MNFKKAKISSMSFFCVLFFSLLFFILSFPDFAFCGLAEDLLARESWRKISLDLEGASLINVLKVFSQQSGLNFIASQNVADKTITLYLENVPIREALEKILDSYNLTYELDEGSNIFVVKSLIRPEVETITRVYFLKYARVNSSPLNTSSAISKAGASLVDAVTALLSSYGKLSEDSRTNSLIITDIPLQFELIEETIRKLDVTIPQVLIEVEIIDTTKNLVDQLGFNWSSADSLFSYVLPSYSGALGWLGVESLLKDDNVEHGTLSLGGSSVSLQHLKTHTDTRVLARPRILTLSNEKAEIKIMGNEVIGTTVERDEVGQITNITAERKDIGVNLIVTASVNPQTREIAMVLEPKVSSVEASGFVDENNNTFQNPQERSAKVTLVIKDNQTIVLGGLLRKDFNETKTKVPILGDIPFLGALFRHREKTEDSDREMLIFITPHIVSTDGPIGIAQLETKHNTEILTQREQSDYQSRKEEIDKALSIWDNR